MVPARIIPPRTRFGGPTIPNPFSIMSVWFLTPEVLGPTKF
jgi:hypothetical protein